MHRIFHSFICQVVPKMSRVDSTAGCQAKDGDPFLYQIRSRGKAAFLGRSGFHPHVWSPTLHVMVMHGSTLLFAFDTDASM